MRRRIRVPDARRAPRRAAAIRAVLALALLAASLTGCAKKGPPSGGPPDVEPPRVLETQPDSGSAGVSTHPVVSVTFSEGMEPRSAGDALEFAPPIAVLQRRWSGRTVSLVLKDSLRADHTYTLFVGAGARDRHGNPLADARAVVFTTSATFPPGMIGGHVEAVGFSPGATSLWLYRDGRRPDSTARDFDALGVADPKGDFRVAGLAPGRWQVWGFADLNHNRSFEPGTDLLVAADTMLNVTAEHPVIADVRLHMINPNAPGRFAGVVVDSVSNGTGIARLIVTPVADTTRRVTYEVPESGSFDFKWTAGEYRVRAYRDLDRNKAWKRDTEPASAEVSVTLGPGDDVNGVSFLLVRPVPGAPGP